ncbi:Phytocyanin domain containing protein [Trema orientale]|uniref:Phytocyanin domain containing protein n=1 Tax=Trema orientale TaxID=63057 RepID=A0A2P5CSS1_TREOI|nr:Phytocyanin domain containing protein [Trema orientale]
MSNSSRLQLFIILAIIAIFVPSISAVEYIVGDESGWTVNFDYQAWATGKEFHVGDKLIFKYPQGVHNVFKVDGGGFRQCTAPAGAEPLSSGNDTITLATPGRKWYICGVAQHCEVGKQKLFITVIGKVLSPASSPSPSQPQPPPPSQNQPSGASTVTSAASGFGLMFLISTSVLGLL